MKGGRQSSKETESLARRVLPKFSDLDQKTLAAFLDQFGLMLQCGLQPSTALLAYPNQAPS